MGGLNKGAGYLVMGAAIVVGGVSVAAFGVFLVAGPFPLVDLGLSERGALAVDLVLSLIFFVQHSGMVRRSFRERLARVVPRSCVSAVYTIASGIALLVLLALWQPSNDMLLSADGPLRWLLRGLFAAAMAGSFWGFRALGSFDSFGLDPIREELTGKAPPALPFTIRGPYRWVRHPLYTFMLVAMWSFPDLTADRLLFNATWTVWVVVGTVLEERDLVRVFGADYRRYQGRVPMLIPFRPPHPPVRGSVT